MSPTTGMATIVRIVLLLALYTACLQDPAEGHPLHKRCPMSKYKKLQPDTMDAARRLQNLQKIKASCTQGLLLENVTNCDIMGTARLPLTLQRLSLVINVLENINTTGNFKKTDLVKRNLEAFSILQDDLMNCDRVESPNLRDCESHLDQYRTTVSSECLENDVLLNLLWILVEDVGYCVHGDQSLESMKKANPRAAAKPNAAKKHKGKKNKKNKKVKRMITI
ncbi:uncharacterized protein [Dendropsophus ebraccatus]|uniref:uncharacterized protein n=1 Tax=Dendropsophus ebraccatus TaxID=150705 RepID=UPI003831304D